jgi:murein DD-endopeptidase MepM/ murein hydrolase activator NlpD
MLRYLRLVLGIGVLAVIYWQIGGFGPITDESDDSREPAPTTEAAADTVAAGGPDDGPSFGYPPLDHESDLEQVRRSVPMSEIEEWDELVIGRNESFYVALRRAGLDHDTIMRVVDAAEPHADLSRVRRGDRFLLAHDEDDATLRAIRFDVRDENYVVIDLSTEETRTELSRYPVERNVRAARGTIRTNLFDALKAQDADPTLADQLAEILGWDIDFFRDLRVGDRFLILYAEYVHDDEIVRDPQILAVRFVNQGREMRAYRYENEFGLPAYYEADGTSLERQFLRAPLKFTRVSSRFSHRRLHPVLKRYRPHYGVDYAAPLGTPVHATADGTVVERSRDRASGNFVGLRHGNGYESYYLHLSRFAKGVTRGGRVSQGQVIGYVGNTGWSTGPHLDYRIKRNGKWIDPNKLSLPPADPIDEADLPAYREHVAALDAQLDTVPVDVDNVVLRTGLAPALGAAVTE